MPFHWCGCLQHDIPYNAMVLLAMLPIALPFLGKLALMAKNKLKERQTCAHCEKEAEQLESYKDHKFI